MLLHAVSKRTISPLGRNVRRLRKAAGLTQPQLAKKSGVSRPTIANLETGYATTASLETAERLAAALGVPLWELTTDHKVGAGAVTLAPYVDAFLESGMGDSLPGGPPTDEELAWLRSVPVAYWGGSPPTPLSIYHLILARRASRS